MDVREKKHKRVTLFIHITGWGLIFGLPLLFSDHSSPDSLRRYLWSSLIPLALIFVFYTNYTLLIDKFLFKRGQMPYFFVANFILIMGVSLALFAIRHYFIARRIPPPPESAIEAFFGFFFRDMVPLILSVGMSIAVKMTNRWISVEKELETVEREKVEAELKTLKSQLNPHFLFNALNTISGLCLTDPDRACKTILVLAAYFRQTLTINEPFVTLEQEVSNVDNYLMLTEARFEGALHVECSLPDDLTKLRLPPLILQPIVENAVRHGFVSVDDRRVSLSIRQDDERAYIRVSDQGPGFPPEVLRRLEDPNDPTYTGLFNVRKRLRSIYGSQCVFTISSTPQGSTVSFSIPLVPPQTPEFH